MKINITISLDEDVYLNQNICELRNNKKLSNHINALLRGSFNIKKEIIIAKEDELETELTKINIKKAVLEEQMEKLRKTKEKEESKWTEMHF